MLITTSRKLDPLTVTFKGSQIICTHTSLLDPLLKQCYEERKEQGNGWTKGRHFRKVAEIDEIAFKVLEKKYPDINSPNKKDQQKAWRKAMSDPEFTYFRTSEGSV